MCEKAYNLSCSRDLSCSFVKDDGRVGAIPTYRVYRFYDMGVYHTQGNYQRKIFALEVASITSILHTQWGQTAIFSASAEAQSEVVKLLIQAGVDLEPQTEVY